MDDAVFPVSVSLRRYRGEGNGKRRSRTFGQPIAVARSEDATGVDERGESLTDGAGFHTTGAAQFALGERPGSAGQHLLDAFECGRSEVLLGPVGR